MPVMGLLYLALIIIIIIIIIIKQLFLSLYFGLYPRYKLRPRYMGTAVAQWLKYCATNRKVAGSIPDGVIGIFH